MAAGNATTAGGTRSQLIISCIIGIYDHPTYRGDRNKEVEREENSL